MKKLIISSILLVLISSLTFAGGPGSGRHKGSGSYYKSSKKSSSSIYRSKKTKTSIKGYHLKDDTRTTSKIKSNTKSKGIPVESEQLRYGVPKIGEKVLKDNNGQEYFFRDGIKYFIKK